jgi:hypothetical protein
MTFETGARIWCSSLCVASRVVSEPCQITPETPISSAIYRDPRKQIVVAELFDGKCVVTLECPSARASGINFQACAFNHSAISPL